MLLSRRVLFEHLWSSAGFAPCSHGCRMRLNVGVCRSKWRWRCRPCWPCSIAYTASTARTPPGNAQRSFQMALCSSSRLRTAVAVAQGKQLSFAQHFCISCSGVMFGSFDGALRLWPKHVKFISARHCDLCRAVAAGFLTNWILVKN